MIYLASPYSSPLEGVEELRYKTTKRFIIHTLRKDNIAIFSSIVYWHRMAVQYGLGRDAQHWMTFNMNMLRRAECMFVLRLHGWENSQGMSVEMKVAKTLTIPMVHFDADFNNLTERGIN